MNLTSAWRDTHTYSTEIVIYPHTWMVMGFSSLELNIDIERSISYAHLKFKAGAVTARNTHANWPNWKYYPNDKIVYTEEK